MVLRSPSIVTTGGVVAEVDGKAGTAPGADTCAAITGIGRDGTAGGMTGLLAGIDTGIGGIETAGEDGLDWIGGTADGDDGRGAETTAGDTGRVCGVTGAGRLTIGGGEAGRTSGGAFTRGAERGAAAAAAALAAFTASSFSRTMSWALLTMAPVGSLVVNEGIASVEAGVAGLGETTAAADSGCVGASGAAAAC